jgi:enolase
MKITDIKAMEVLDSRGKPTVRAYVKLEDGSIHKASVPSGSSTGSHEALELRDGGNRFLGEGVLKAVEHINTTLKQVVVGMSTLEPDDIDKAMIAADGTENKTNIGANAMLAVSMAAVKAAAHASEIPRWKFINGYYFANNVVNFPRLMVNVVNGGKHAGWNFDFQEFMVSPLTNVPTESTRIGSEIFLHLGKLLKSKKLQVLVGDEGGYSPAALTSNEEVLETIVQAATNAGYTNTVDYRIALDVASTEFYKDGVYTLQKTGEVKTAEQLSEYYMQIGQKYSIESFEDPFAEDDWSAFASFTKMGKEHNFMVVGDDLFVTNQKRLERGIQEQSANALLVKVNQIGTMYETAKAMIMAKEAGFANIVSHRSGETEDNFIADIAYGFGAEFIKTGSMSRSERLCKYNRLLEIQQMKEFGVL